MLQLRKSVCAYRNENENVENADGEHDCRKRFENVCIICGYTDFFPLSNLYKQQLSYNYCLAVSTFINISSKCMETVYECLTPLRLYLAQSRSPELRRHLELLMDHNEDEKRVVGQEVLRYHRKTF